MRYEQYCDFEAAMLMIIDEFHQNMRNFETDAKQHQLHVLNSNPKVTPLEMMAMVNTLIRNRK